MRVLVRAEESGGSGLAGLTAVKISCVQLRSAEIFAKDAAGKHWQLLFPAKALSSGPCSGNQRTPAFRTTGI
jgi:hypothetical protein